MNYKNHLLAVACTILGNLSLTGQVGIGTTSPDPSSMLDITSTEAGILIPRMTETEKEDIDSPVKGLLVFQDDGNEGFWYFDGTIWVPIDNKGEFISIGGVIRNTTNRKVDDFVVGSTTLENITGGDDDRRLFFDKSRGAFRAGYNDDDSWDDSKRGNYSVALGYNTIASGQFSTNIGRGGDTSGDYAVSLGRDNIASGQGATSFGYSNESSGAYSTTMGRNTTATGDFSIAGVVASTATGLHSIALGNTSKATAENSFALGRLNQASGLNSIAFGFTNIANTDGAIAIGSESRATGDRSVALGNNLLARSYSEVAVGLYNTDYTPASTSITVGEDRIFSVGNGFRTGGVTTFNNALTILKNGHVGIGTDTPGEALEIHGDDNFSGDADFDAHSYGTNITSFHIRSAFGTQNNPTAVSGKANANFYNMEAQGYDGTAYRNASAIRMGSMANNRTGASDMPGRIDFHTSTDGTIDNKLRMRLDDNGNVGIGTNNAVLTEKLEVNGKIKAVDVNFSGLPVFAGDAAAATGGLTQGDMYRTAGGALRIKL
ncbi:hypothetical protein DCS32_13835 [Dokdonia sp. Dokd-P16]|uniref:hypothetical protein n=1 Tax=Dokdonia sp. Dokd-P16 TaxID=2173169 RepID=UPI000D545511|nr:hypothetical protein [Dokdonia sp. Dokd-P16]AWH75205.1 hypothetical protein DCS32_13835 [Dokdonia sp. Dokd-P16]